MDRWGVDVLITGSQKALMLPPGLALIALSERAWARAEKHPQRAYYFDLLRERTNQAKNTTAYTPAISLVIGLREAAGDDAGRGLRQRLRPPRAPGASDACGGHRRSACAWWRPTIPARQ